ncbi:MAG: TIGR04282 family arsenosugar biosynthesis glycosyltransferase [Chthoniobacterales bacterium]
MEFKTQTARLMKAVHEILDPRSPARVPEGLCALAVMTKAPRAGQVKTRLSPPLTPQEAAALNRCFLRDTTAALSVAVEGGKAKGIGVYTPAGAEDAFAEILPPHFALVVQRGEAFGERLIAATHDLFQLGFDSICLIDSDSPTVPLAAYFQAVAWLLHPDPRIVLGPSDDGGYYLIGLNRNQRRVFEEIDWSTERVYEQTIARAAEIGVEVKLLPTWYDVDDRSTLRRLCDELLGEEIRAGSGYAAPETRSFLEAVIAREGRERIWPQA